MTKPIKITIHAPCSDEVVSSIAIIANFLGRARRPWIIEQHRDSLLLNVPKLQALAALPSTTWVLSDFCDFGTAVEKTDIFLYRTRGSLGFAQICSPNVLGLVDTATRQDAHIPMLVFPAQTHFPLMNSPALPDFLSPLSCFSP